MKRTQKLSVSLSADELGIINAIANRHNMSASEMVRHLLIYQGLVGGDMPLTTRILALPDAERARIVAEIRRRAESNNPIKPQSFRAWVKEILGRDDPATMERGADRLLGQLLNGLLDSPATP